MKELLLEIAICAAAAAFLMVFHELSKAIVYMGIQRLRKNSRTYSHSIWEIQRYLDPVGIILSITSGVAFSRPFMFRIQDKKTNRLLGITGFSVSMGRELSILPKVRNSRARNFYYGATT